MGERTANIEAAEALAAAAGGGPFFTIEPWARGAGWRPASLLRDPAVLARRVAHARTVIAGRAGVAAAEVAERVAASIVFLGLASRLVSPSLGAAVLGGVVPYLTLDNLWWRPADGDPVPLAAGPVTGWQTGDAADSGQLDEAAALLSEHCVQGMAVPVASVFQATFQLSPLVLRGNIASALAAAAGMLATSYPGRAETAGQLTARMLALEPLRGTGELVQPDAAQPRRFLVRRSCCLYYRVPGGGTCGDCVLTPAHVRHQQWRAV
ncbi:MAG: (2Fe-2S)-binding protein [Actinomycetota bacterium]|nr:(2Fe-2S)-binding protein [Actinomycetota bacterium]